MGKKRSGKEIWIQPEHQKNKTAKLIRHLTSTKAGLPYTKHTEAFFSYHFFLCLGLGLKTYDSLVLGLNLGHQHQDLFLH